MIPANVINSVEDWAKKRDRKNTETLKVLALAYLKENNIDWNTTSGKANVVSYIDEFYYGETRKDTSFNEDWMGHKTEQNPFELSLDEIFPSDSNNEVESDDALPKDNQNMLLAGIIKQPDTENVGFIHRINLLPYSFEIKEILKELDDKAYKSPILSNLDTHGRLKLIRKAKILIYLQKQTGKI